MSDGTPYPVARLTEFIAAIFVRLGLSPEAADLSAKDMIQTNLWGIDSHGILRLPIYVTRLQNGAVNPAPNLTSVATRPSFEVLDGDSGLGYVVGHHAMDRAIELARSNGIGAVTIRNSNHYGAAALYVKQATEAGFVAFSMTNVGPNLVVPGGAAPITGNNPLAFGAPTRLGFPLLLDISMSTVAGGKLLLAQEKGEKIPLGWATDGEGRPTEDPAVGFAGFLLPVGGHKGFGLSLMVDLLCGVLSGGAFQFDIGHMYRAPEKSSRTGHMMIVIDPCIAMERETFLERMDSFHDTIKASPMWDETARMLIPGELENECEQRRKQDGVPLPDSLVADLNRIAEELDLPTLLATS